MPARSSSDSIVPTTARSPLLYCGPHQVTEEAGADLEFVPHARLVARFREAVDIFLGDARAADLPRYWRNLNTVERDFLRAPETEVDLPEYIDR
jgi:hypothetical protein